MPLNTVTLTWNLPGLQQNMTYNLTVIPTAVTPGAPGSGCSLAVTGPAGQLPGVIACDNANVGPAGWAYVVTMYDTNGMPVFGPLATAINYAGGAVQNLTSLTAVPAAVTAAAGLAAETSRAETAETLLAPKASPALTGTATAPTAATSDATTQVATDAFVHNVVTAAGGGAGLASPAFTGIPTAPTAATSDATTQVATDAFVHNVVTAQNLGTAAAQPASAFMTSSGGGQEVLSAAVVAAGTYTINLASGNVFNLTLDQSTVFTFTVASSTTACSFTLYLVQGGSGGYTVTWPASVTWLGGLPPVLPTPSGATSVFVFETLNGGTSWTGFTVPNLPLGVVNGGLGVQSLTYYALLAGGSTSTGPVQSLPAGAAGQALISQGPGTLPAWAAPFLTPIALQTANFTLAPGQFAPVSTAGGAVTATLPTAPPNLTMVGVKMTAQAGTNALNLQLGGSDVLNVAGGLQTGSLALLNQSAVFIYYAAAAIWYSAANDLPLSQLDLRYPPLTGATFTGAVAAPDFAPSGLTGATAASRYVGATVSGHPASGTFVTGDWCVDQTGVIWVCTAGGTQGTWAGISPGVGLGTNTFTGNQTAPAWVGGGLSGATAASRYVGATVSGAPSSGTWLVGDWCVDQSGKIWVCTVAGTGAGASWTNAAGSGGGGGATTGGNTFTGNQTAPSWAASGLTGATSASRYVGATVSGPPVSGTFLTGDWVVDQSGTVWVCSAGGTQGTWSCPQAPNTGWEPGDNGFLTSSFIPLWNMTSNYTPTVGYIYLYRMPVRSAMTITSLNFAGETAASSTTSTGTYAAVITPAGSRVALSADAGPVFGAALTNGLFTIPMVTPVLVSPPWVYAALVINMSNLPVLWGTSTAGQARAAANIGLAAGSYQFANSASGQTSIPSSVTLSGYTASTVQPCFVGAR